MLLEWLGSTATTSAQVRGASGIAARDPLAFRNVQSLCCRLCGVAVWFAPSSGVYSGSASSSRVSPDVSLAAETLSSSLAAVSGAGEAAATLAELDAASEGAPVVMPQLPWHNTVMLSALACDSAVGTIRGALRAGERTRPSVGPGHAFVRSPTNSAALGELGEPSRLPRLAPVCRLRLLRPFRAALGEFP